LDSIAGLTERSCHEDIEPFCLVHSGAEKSDRSAVIESLGRLHALFAPHDLSAFHPAAGMLLGDLQSGDASPRPLSAGYAGAAVGTDGSGEYLLLCRVQRPPRGHPPVHRTEPGRVQTLVHSRYRNALLAKSIWQKSVQTRSSLSDLPAY